MTSTRQMPAAFRKAHVVAVFAAINLILSALDAAHAQTPSTPLPFDTPYGQSINLQEARGLLDTAIAEATKRGWNYDIAVVDPSGDLLAFARMNDAPLASIAVAQQKARIAARFRRETRVFAEAISHGHPELATLDPFLAATSGGFPIISRGHLVGAIGCSAGTGDQDATVCKAAIEARASSR